MTLQVGLPSADLWTDYSTPYVLVQSFNVARAAETGPESTASGGMSWRHFLFPSMSLSLFIHPLLPVFRFRALHDTPMPAVKDETTGTRLLRTCGVIKVLKYKVLGHSSIWESPDHG